MNNEYKAGGSTEPEIKNAKKLIAEALAEVASLLEGGAVGMPVKIAVSAVGAEHGEIEVARGAALASEAGASVTLICTERCGLKAEGMTEIVVSSEREAEAVLSELLESGAADGGVTMHHTFPIGVATVGRATAPSNGGDIFIAATTGTSSTDRVTAMVRNAVYGIAAAKACGIARPLVGILNIDGARSCESALKKMRARGYDFDFARSGRSAKGAIMRGNDVLTASCDVLVCDSLTGNVLMKMLAAFTSGGGIESSGYGYGPGLGEGMRRPVMIVSRATGANVVKNAVLYAAQLLRGNVEQVLAAELAAAKRAGLEELRAADRAPETGGAVSRPAKEVVTEQIAGIEIMELDGAVGALSDGGIYAEAGMGCTGPIVLVSAKNSDRAAEILREKGFISI